MPPRTVPNPPKSATVAGIRRAPIPAVPTVRPPAISVPKLVPNCHPIAEPKNPPAAVRIDVPKVCP